MPLFVGLNDLRKAFPSFNRVKLLEDMVEAKVASKVVALLGHLYLLDTFQLQLDSVPSGSLLFCVVVGVPEDSCLSPVLFIYFIWDLPSVLAPQASNFSFSVIGGRSLCCMIFADDMNLLAYEHKGAQTLADASTDFFVK